MAVQFLSRDPMAGTLQDRQARLDAAIDLLQVLRRENAALLSELFPGVV
jgi:hypothetical protein